MYDGSETESLMVVVSHSYLNKKYQQYSCANG